MLIIGQNSVVTTLEADEYLTDRSNSTGWFSLPEDSSLEPGSFSKESLLVTSFRSLQDISNGKIAATSTDDNIKKAQIELALYYSKHLNYTDEREGPITAGMSEYEIRSRREKYYEDVFSTVPSRIKNTLLSYVSFGGYFVNVTENIGEGCE